MKKLLLVLFIIAFISTVLGVYTHTKHEDTIEEVYPVLGNLKEIEIECLRARLLYKEMISRNKDISSDIIYDHLDKAKQLAANIIEPAEHHYGTIDSNGRHNTIKLFVGKIINNLIVLKEQIHKRANLTEEVLSGSEIDIKTDEYGHEVSLIIKKTLALISADALAHLRASSMSFKVLMALIIIALAIVSSLMIRYEKHRARDYKNLKKAAEVKEILLKEIHHRVKNNMQIIESLLALQQYKIEDSLDCSNRADDRVEGLIASRTRISVMALTHELLYNTESISFMPLHEYIKKLSENLNEFYDMDKVSISFHHKGTINIKIDDAIPIGLIINEIISNAYKHAFPGDMKGNIEIKVSIEDNRFIMLRISDNGIGIPDIDQKKFLNNNGSLGFTLIRNLTEQIGGKLKISNSDGLVYEIMFKLKESG